MELQDFMTLIFDFGFAIASAMIPYVSWRIGEYFKLKKDSEVRAYLDQALNMALQYGRSKVENSVTKLAATAVKNNETIEHAAYYAASAVPAALQRFNITPERLKEMLEARLK